MAYEISISEKITLTIQEAAKKCNTKKLIYGIIFRTVFRLLFLKGAYYGKRLKR